MPQLVSIVFVVVITVYARCTPITGVDDKIFELLGNDPLFQHLNSNDDFNFGQGSWIVEESNIDTYQPDIFSDTEIFQPTSIIEGNNYLDGSDSSILTGESSNYIPETSRNAYLNGRIAPLKSLLFLHSNAELGNSKARALLG